MSREFLKSLSEEFKKTREEKGFTLEQIYGRTRIDLKFLQAIESSNFDIMPDVYMKAFIKEYAEFIGLDGEGTLKKYELAKAGKPYDESEPEQTNDETEITTAPKQSKVFDASNDNNSANHYNPSETKNNNLIFIAGGAVIIIAVAVYFLFFNSSTEQIIIETPYEEVIKEQNSRFEAEDKKPETENTVETSEKFELKILAADTSWIKLIIDNIDNQEYILNPNSTKNFEANNSIDLTLGNSGGITLFLNNQQLDFKGVKGRVRNLRIDANGYSLIRNN